MNTLLRRTSVVCLAIAAAIGVSPGGLRAEPSESAPVNSEAQSAISIAGSHACVVTSTGEVKCWGNNNSGQVGIVAGTTYVAGPVAATGMTNAVSVVTGQDYSCALDDQGDMYCWGSNSSGQLGIGNNNSTHVASAVVNMPAPVVSIGAGWYHTCAALDTGQLACWGSGMNGQLGQNVPNSNAPVLVQGLTSDITAVSAGDGFTCALSSSGSVTCFGKNSNGASGALPQPTQQCFGMPPFQFCNTVYADAPPTAVTGFGSATAEAVSAGTDHACAVLSDGTVACWGRNDAGQLGVSGGSNHVAAVVPGVSDAVAVTAGTDHTCALESSGTVKCWGSNAEGQLGDGTFTNRPSATTVVGVANAVGVNAGTRATCAALSSGAVHCWGDNAAMLLGRGFSFDVTTPSAVSALSSGVTALDGGKQHHCALIGSAELKCWGSNSSNQIDASSMAATPVPTLVSGLVSGQVTITSVALGYRHTCVSLSDFTMKCWGDNNWGQLGRGDTNPSGVPTSPSGLSGVQVAEVFAHGDQSCLVTVDGDAMCWGGNWFGQLGLGDSTARNVPTAVVGVPAGVDVVDIAMGYEHMCLTYSPSAATGYGVMCVGRNHTGQLGIGNTTTQSQLTNVTGLDRGVSSIIAGKYHSCALLDDQTVKCWGGNGVGELGNGAGANVPNAVTVAGLSGVTKIAAGDRHTCAALAAGGMKCWGTNSFGEIGNGTPSFAVTVPTAVSGLSSVVSAMSGTGEDQMHGSTCAVVGGAVSCWGSDRSGQAAQGYVPKSVAPGAIAGAFTVPVPVVAPTPSPQVPVFIPPSSTPPSVAPRPFDASMVADAELVTFSGLSSRLFVGQPVSFETNGFTPGAAVEVYLASTPRLLTTVTADADGRVAVVFTVPGDLVGEHHVVLYEPESGRAVRQAVTIAPLTLPVTGPGDSSTDLIVTIALFLLIFGVLGEKFARQRRFLHPEHQGNG